ncbi:MAG: dihydropteroate synthase [Planctomycetes bacterium]|nr:dihydropteroate synthase [Planctomycetota bacterium]MBL7041803.1 dihydropteroate synthase [Pirellulaceae bacterium]
MNWADFIVVGENIHCSRIVKRGGIKTAALPDGGEAVKFTHGDAERFLSVPADWERRSPAFAEGKIKHVALAIYQSLHGTDDDRATGEDYLCYQADRQIAGGATFLDLNVDEYSMDPAEASEVMAHTARFLSSRYDTPLSIDSSNADILRIGLRECRKDIKSPMLNSVSLERMEAAELIKEFNADVIVNAAGREGMPADAEQRMANFREVVGKLESAEIPRERMHLDPLVLPVSTDSMYGRHFMEATAQAAKEFDGVHLNGGLSNISFGMPARKLLNMVFMHLCAEAGTDGGIIDPAATPMSAMSQLDPESEPFKLAKAVLTGEDMFGMEFIGAYREGRLK